MPPTDYRELSVGGQRLRVGVRPGAGTARAPLLIFNGIGANLELLEPFTAALAGVETITFDVPGVGGSALPPRPYRFFELARLAQRMLTELGYDGQVDVMGVSWGGALAQQFALQHPDRCRRLVLAATSAGFVMVPGKWSALRRMVSPRRYRDRDYLQKVGGELYGGAFRRDPDLLREHGRHLSPPRSLGYLYQLLAAWGWTSVPWLRALKQPTLVIAGDDDPIVPKINGKLLASLIPNSTLSIIDDGHLFLASQPGRSADLVLSFLGEDAERVRDLALPA